MRQYINDNHAVPKVKSPISQAVVVAFIDLKDISIVNQLFIDYFEATKYPARTIYQTAALPYGGKVKVTAIGLKEQVA